MKSKNDLSITYMGNLQNAWYASETADIREINDLLGRLRYFSGPLLHSMPLFYVIDYTAQQYLVMSEAVREISGYHPREFLESRLEKLIEVYHKDDFAIFNQHIFAMNASFLKSRPQTEHHQYIFSNNFRFINQNKKISSVLQRAYYMTSGETGLPSYAIGMVIDITDVKTDTVMVHSIEKVGLYQDTCCKELIQRNYFYPDQEISVLTRREKIVLQYLCEGYSSKQLADRLFVSERTIVNHKQNMLKKTNTKNTVELVAFSLRNHLI